MDFTKRQIKNWPKWKERLRTIIFEADTPTGKFFDVALLLCIVLSILAVMLESVAELQQLYSTYFLVAEWIFTIFFTIEYILRLICVYRPIRYATSFFGVVDLLSILPTYFSLLFPLSRSLMAVRALRLIRVFRIFKLGGFLKEGSMIIDALKKSHTKITVFLTFITLMVIVLGSVMYLVEGTADSGFTSIPRSVYWAIVTLTTVGYGDIAPVTALGQFIAAIIMIMGYGVLAVPTGIVSAEMVKQVKQDQLSTRVCKACMMEGHDADASFCKYCGEEL